MFSSEIRKELAAFESLSFDEPLKPHISLRVGGSADGFVSIGNGNLLHNLLLFLHKVRIPTYFLGRGTNIIFNDVGFRGVVIKLDGDFKSVEQTFCDEKKDVIHLRVGAALGLQKLVQYSTKHNLAGMEEGAGIPGSIGGATFMNAGTPKWEFGDRILKIEGLNSKNQFQTLSKRDFNFEYRQGNLPSRFLVTYVTVALEQGDSAKLKERVNQILTIRKARQPLQYPNCGSVFKNPPNDYAGRLIESCGLKGTTIGGAQVSKKHANFIVNPEYKAKAQDVIDLIELIGERVYKQHGILLESEVQIIKS